MTYYLISNLALLGLLLWLGREMWTDPFERNPANYATLLVVLGIFFINL
jgi:hypothetical protein